MTKSFSNLSLYFLFFTLPLIPTYQSGNHQPYSSFPRPEDWNYFLKVGGIVHYSSQLPSKPTNCKEITKLEKILPSHTTLHPSSKKIEPKEVLTTKVWSPKVCFNRDSWVNSCNVSLYDGNLLYHQQERSYSYRDIFRWSIRPIKEVYFRILFS
jgi:hypothetical protein